LVSQLLLAGPLLAMYEGSIWMAKFWGKKEGAEKKEEDKSDSSSFKP
jgi:Sec-independent protein secretion pathway component TatC